MTSTITKVQNYQGTNSFVLKMKEVIKKWGNLTPNQITAVEKALSSSQNFNVDELPENMKVIATYDGPNNFVNEIKTKLTIYGVLTDKQVDAAMNFIQKEREDKKVHNMRIPTPGETIKVGRAIGQKLKETYSLKFNPIILDITKILGFTNKAVKFSGKMTVKRGDVCCVCARTLTDELSMLSGVGKLCSAHVGVPYLTNKSQSEKYRNEYLKKIDEIGEMEFWVPKSQIKLWDGKSEIFLKMISV
jgi:hypothetical protein